MKESIIKSKYGSLYCKASNDFTKERTLVLLHGFGMNLDTFTNLENKINDFNIITYDFPGFGRSSEPTKTFTIKDYSDSLQIVLDYYGEKNNIYLLGHSFGGRVAIYYSSYNKVNKVFLVNAKAFKNKSIKYKLKILKYKIIKYTLFAISKKRYLNYISSKGSSDYKMLSNNMKKTFVKIVNYDLKKHLKKIKCEVIVIGSVNDEIVNYDETLKIYKYIKKAKLYPFFNSNHFSYIEEESKLLRILNKETKI